MCVCVYIQTSTDLYMKRISVRENVMRSIWYAITFGRALVSMVAGAINVSSIRRFSIAALVFVGVELFLFLRAGDGVPYKIYIDMHSDKN